MASKPWTQLKQVPVNAWFRFKADKNQVFRITKLTYQPTEGIAFHDAHPIALKALCNGEWEFSQDLKTWQPCGLPEACPECGNINLGYCIPEAEAPEGWFCGQCGAPEEGRPSRFKDPRNRPYKPPVADSIDR